MINLNSIFYIKFLNLFNFYEGYHLTKNMMLKNLKHKLI
jgi:hypothetical protein